MWLTAIIVNLLHLLYFIITTTTDLFPFNNIRGYSKKQKFREVSINGLLMSVPVIALLVNIPVFIIAGIVILALLIAAEYFSWWHHYFFGPTPQWQHLYDTLFKSTIKILPPIKTHPVPNLEHTILHALTLCGFITTSVYYFSGYQFF